MEKIFDGRTFAEKLRVRGYAKRETAIAGVGGQRAAQLDSRAGRDGALFDDEFRRASFGRNLAGSMIDGREVRVPALFRRRADANKNCLTGANGLTGVRRERDASRFTRGSEHLVEMMLINGHTAGLELRDPCAIDIRANYLVSCFSETRSSYQANVATTNHREMQVGSSKNGSGAEQLLSEAEFIHIL
jgi:hypothetical protein